MKHQPTAAHEPLFRVLTEIIEVICRRHLEDLRIFTEDVNGVPTLVVMPHAADYPRLVGKHGGQVNAILYLVQRAATRLNERIGFALRESFVGDREPVEAFAFNPDFDVVQFHERLSRLSEACIGERWNYRVTPVGDILVASVPCDRNVNSETFISALEAAFKPYCFGCGRKLQLKPQFINPETDTELLRQR